MAAREDEQPMGDTEARKLRRGEGEYRRLPPLLLSKLFVRER